MTRAEIRTLRGQAIAVAILLVGGIVAAIVIGTQRWRFDHYVRRVVDAPKSARARVIATPNEAMALSRAERILLYEDWVSRAGGSAAASADLPAALMSADAAACLRRVEKSFVFGGDEKRSRGLQFLVAAGHADALPLLERAEARARKRSELAWAEALQRASAQIAAGAVR